MDSSDPRGRSLNVLYSILLVALVAITTLLILQNRDLKARVTELESASAEALPQLEVGDVVEPFALPALDGTMTRLDFSDPDSETLLLFFSPDCPACQRNFPNWLEIEQAGRRDNRRVVFVSTVPEERTRQYVAGKGVTGEVLIGDPNVLDAYKVARIPTTVQIGADGMVTGVWTGVLSETVVREL